MNLAIFDSHPEENAGLKLYLETGGHTVLMGLSQENIIKKSISREIAVIISEVEHANGNGLALASALSMQGLKTPIIFLTHTHVDDLLLSLTMGRVGVVLQKPFNKDHLLPLIEIMTSNEEYPILDKLLPGSKHLSDKQILGSEQAGTSAADITDLAKKSGASDKIVSSIKLVYSEMILNAVYHAHGYSEEKRKRQAILLKPHQLVHYSVAISAKEIAVSIIDNSGKLDRPSILTSFNKIIFSEREMKNFIMEKRNPMLLMATDGRGLNMSRRMSSRYLIKIIPGKKTEIVTFFPINENKSEVKDGFNTDICIIEK